MTGARLDRSDATWLDGLIVVAHRHRRWLWLVPAIPTAVLAALIMVVLPPKQTLGNVADWAFRLSPFLLGVITVALVPRWRLGPVLVLLSTIVFMGFVDTGLVLRILAFGAAPDEQQDAAFQDVYQWELLTATFVVLALLLAYRMGGAHPASVFKVGLASILVVVSGLNDLTFWLSYDWSDGRPSHLEWASHIIVFVGGPPSIATAVVFLVVHLALAVAVMFLPLRRYIDRAVARGEHTT